MSDNNNQELDTKTQIKLDSLLKSVNERVEEIRRELNTSLNEMEFHLLEKINKNLQLIEAVSKRVAQLEDASAWNQLLEEAEKSGLTPEQMLRKALSEYTEKHKGGE